MSTVTSNSRMDGNVHVAVLNLSIVGVACNTAHELRARIEVASQLQVLDGSTVQSVEEAATLAIVVNINVVDRMALTVELATEAVVALVDGLHANTSHVDILHELSLNRIVSKAGNSTEGNELLDIAKEVVTILVLSRKNLSYCRLRQSSRILSFLRGVRASEVCFVHLSREVIENLRLNVAEDILTCLNPFASILIFLYQRQVAHFERTESVGSVEQGNVCLLAFVNLLEEAGELLGKSSLSLYAVSSVNTCDKLFKGSPQLSGEVRSRMNILFVRLSLDDALSTSFHVLKNQVESFAALLCVFTTIDNLEGTPACPVTIVVRARILDADGELTVLAYNSDGVNLIATCICSSCHTCFALSTIAKESSTILRSLTLVGGEEVIVDS